MKKKKISNMISICGFTKKLVVDWLDIGKSHIAIFDIEKCVIVSKNSPHVVTTKATRI
jgi:hypothetical protein